MEFGGSPVKPSWPTVSWWDGDIFSEWRLQHSFRNSSSRTLHLGEARVELGKGLENADNWPIALSLQRPVYDSLGCHEGSRNNTSEALRCCLAGESTVVTATSFVCPSVPLPKLKWSFCSNTIHEKFPSWYTCSVSALSLCPTSHMWLTSTGNVTSEAKELRF